METRRTQRHHQALPRYLQPSQSAAVYMSTAAPRKLCECPTIKTLESHGYWDQLLMVVFLASHPFVCVPALVARNLKIQAHS